MHGPCRRRGQRRGIAPGPASPVCSRIVSRLPRPAMRPGRRSAVGSLAILATIALASCRSGDGAGDGVGEVVEGPSTLEQFADSPDAAGLLAVLDERPAVVRERLGPHRLRVSSHFEMGPEDPPGVPEVGDRVIRSQVVNDELSLVWVGVDEDDRPSFELHQHNDQDQGRDVVVAGGRVYTRAEHRPWFVRELEGGAHELWLADAYRAVRDAVALAAPRLDVATSEGGETLRVDLSRSASKDRDLIPRDERSSWRFAGTVDSVEGHVTLDRATGAWLEAEVKIAHHLESADGRILRGRLELSASLEPLATPPGLQVPADALPSPERLRPQEERDALLDGLAAQ